MKLLTGVDHIAIAVKNLESALIPYEKLLGLEVYHRETIASQGIHAAFVRVGDLTIELMEPFDPSCYIARHIKKNGQGFAHICFKTDDLDKLVDRLSAAGLVFLNQEPFRGAQGKSVIFLHPKDNSGVLTEFCQYPE